MRPNPVKAALARGETAVGTMAFEFFTPSLPQIVKAAGGQFLLYDMEHSGAGIDVMKAQFAACRGIDIVPLVRVPATEYHFVARLLDAGALGVMVPMVETAEQAARIVSFTRYPPLGRRGAAFGVAPHDDYLAAPVTDTMAAAHERTLVICLVETAVGIENVDAIAAVPGVDVVWLGHFDLTNFMGIPAQFTHPRFLAAVDVLLAACRRHGKAAGFLAADDTWASEYRAKGFRALAYGTDVGLMQGALAAGIARLNAGR
jgi:2-dehydro-3-deoxyglucarate aldolase/4-hydroxy-2-oxoheptanedioate aldolase